LLNAEILSENIDNVTAVSNTVIMWLLFPIYLFWKCEYKIRNINTIGTCIDIMSHAMFMVLYIIYCALDVNYWHLKYKIGIVLLYGYLYTILYKVHT